MEDYLQFRVVSENSIIWEGMRQWHTELYKDGNMGAFVRIFRVRVGPESQGDE